MTDYEGEARHLERYRKLVADMPEVIVPRVDRSLTTRHILAMDWIEGEPLEALASEAVPQPRRNAVARSVDSDVENLASLLRRLDFLPMKVDVPALAAEAKRQLKLETDYEAEARHLERYRKLVADMPDVVVPRVDRSLTTRHVLAMDWIEGESLESLTSEAVPQPRRNAVDRILQELMFRELFEFRFMQTDPNIANYLYLPATQQLALLDLGSVGEYPAAFVEGYRRVCRGVLADDPSAIRGGGSHLLRLDR